MSVNASQSSVWLQLLWGHFLSSHSLAADWFSSIMLERCHQFDQLCAEFKQDSTGSCLLSAHEVQQNQDVLEHSCWSGRPVGLWSERLSPDSAGVCDWSDDGSDLSGFVLLTSLRFCQVLCFLSSGAVFSRHQLWILSDLSARFSGADGFTLFLQVRQVISGFLRRFEMKWNVLFFIQTQTWTSTRVSVSPARPSSFLIVSRLDEPTRRIRLSASISSWRQKVIQTTKLKRSGLTSDCLEVCNRKCLQEGWRAE